MSANATPMIASWNGGELSPMMAGRTDTTIYAIGAEVMENFAPAVEGPVVKRPGFERIKAAAASSTWLMRFVFNTTQAYVIECLEQKLRFYTNGGRIEGPPGTPVEVTVPFAAAEWPRVSTQRRFDRLYMAHANHPPGRLNRTGAETFSWETLPLKNGPFKDGNGDEAVTVTVSGTLTVGGSVTLTASSAIFLEGHEGAFFRIEAKDFSNIHAWQPGIDNIVAGTSKVRSEGKVYVAASAGRTGPVAPTHVEGTEWDGDPSGQDVNEDSYGVQWTYLYDSFGVVEIDSVSSGTSATATVTRRLPESLTSVASWRWAHGAFSDAEGWPDLVFIWAGRLCFFKDFDLHASVAGDYLNFQGYSSVDYLTDDLAFLRPLDAEDAPMWVVADRDLFVGTASGEYVIGKVNPQAPLSGQNIDAKRQSGYGGSSAWPAQPGTATVYMQRGGTNFREAQYSFGSDRYESANINRWARHIARPGIVQLGQQAVPEELLFAVRSDGQLVTRTYDPEQQVKGFARTILGGAGEMLSAVSIPSEDGSYDELWALCDWNGSKSIQRQSEYWRAGEMTLDDAFFVDDGLRDDLGESPSATISGLTHLIGSEVAILADGSVCPRQTVPPSGTITIPFAASRRAVGRPYTAILKTLPIEARDPSGQTSQGKRSRLVKLILRLLDTLTLKARVTSNTAATGYRDEQLLDRPNSADMDGPPPLFSGDTDGRGVGGDWGRDGRFTVVSDDPVPAIVLAGMPDFQVSAS